MAEQTKSHIADPPTGLYFFYGTLMDPTLLVQLLHLDKLPDLRPASIKGYKFKLWGPYPALLDDEHDDSAVIEGAVYNVESVEHAHALANYETKNYTTGTTTAYYSDGQQPETDQVTIYVFAGNRSDLSEGDFNLQRWMKMMGRGKVLDDLAAKKAGPAKKPESS
ncbi:hypothetical protein TMEN_2888 [Trichophyton mentagrophytes]|uniref:Putative gamma-glutamylcyclotransferase n=1 Tax=Trichophyton interdigitale (strain MR816) TaxID=1215338 RepID=A0A059JE63_TRIIM|nr:hypothetical protein H101_06417 [Trichophyton interdigitale H6]KAG5207374.1 GGACT domain-containing protein [Trichophyton interdigitale]KDB26089.1 hypothetical protein H109_02096 [Trichophyton interdigitale MR816]GBF60454.1 hypothetical protein TMEN_2888 [Trichophyton mentagrophytes]KAG5217897.1 GGACT domain-containing protein [Trichophyton interdigitale]